MAAQRPPPSWRSVPVVQWTNLKEFERRGMSLTGSDLEWIRRLGDEIKDRDRVPLIRLRRRTTDPSDIRLLDSLLAGQENRDGMRRERQQLERRRDQLKWQLSQEGK